MSDPGMGEPLSDQLLATAPDFFSAKRCRPWSCGWVRLSIPHPSAGGAPDRASQAGGLHSARSGHCLPRRSEAPTPRIHRCKRSSVTTFDPGHADAAKLFGQTRLQLKGFPPPHRIEMLHEIGKKPNTEAAGRTTRLVASLMLIEAPVRIARRLTDIEAPRVRAAIIVQQYDIDGVRGSTGPRGARLQCVRGGARLRHPERPTAVLHHAAEYTMRDDLGQLSAGSRPWDRGQERTFRCKLTLFGGRSGLP